MKIGLSNTYASHLLLQEKPSENILSNDETISDQEAFSDLKYVVDFKSTESKSFCIIFKLIISTEEYNIDTTFCAMFETDEDIVSEFMTSPFPTVNAPAIAYPFLRSYINTITVNSGFRPTILSALNFTVFKDFYVMLDNERLLNKID